MCLPLQPYLLNQSYVCACTQERKEQHILYSLQDMCMSSSVRQKVNLFLHINSTQHAASKYIHFFPLMHVSQRLKQIIFSSRQSGLVVIGCNFSNPSSYVMNASNHDGYPCVRHLMLPNRFIGTFTKGGGSVQAPFLS